MDPSDRSARAERRPPVKEVDALILKIETSLTDNRLDDAKRAIAKYWQRRSLGDGTDATDARIRTLASQVFEPAHSLIDDIPKSDATLTSLSGAINDTVRSMGLQYRGTFQHIMHFSSIRDLPNNLIDVTLDAIVDVLLSSTNPLIQEEMATVESVAIRRDDSEIE
jgi:hypothetical protein